MPASWSHCVSRQATWELANLANTRNERSEAAYRSVKGQYEAALGIVFRGRTITAVSSALEILKSVVGVMQNSCLLACLLSAQHKRRSAKSLSNQVSNDSSQLLNQITAGAIQQMHPVRQVMAKQGRGNRSCSATCWKLLTTSCTYYNKPIFWFRLAQD